MTVSSPSEARIGFLATLVSLPLAAALTGLVLFSTGYMM